MLSDVSDLLASPADRVVFAGWDMDDLVKALGPEMDVVTPYALWGIRAQADVSSEGLDLVERASEVFVQDRGTQQAIKGKATVWIGYHPLLVATPRVVSCPQAKGVVFVARDDTPPWALAQAAAALGRFGKPYSFLVLERKVFLSGNVLVAAGALGISSRFATGSLDVFTTAIAQARAVVALCPEAVNAAVRYQKPLIIPPSTKQARWAGMDVCLSAYSRIGSLPRRFY